jgi:hypothetical protein
MSKLKLKRFSNQYDWGANQASVPDQAAINGEGWYKGEYYDFLFIYQAGDEKNQIRFQNSSYGDDEFEAMCYINDGIAQVFSMEDYEKVGKKEINDDLTMN